MPGRPTSRRNRLVAAASCCLPLVLMGAPPPAAASAATGPRLVALGDSYSSGVGTRQYYAHSGACQRSPYAYPVKVAALAGASLHFKACSGATTRQVRRSQLGVLTRSTDIVTISVGGNDAGFTKVLVECAKPRLISDCPGAVAEARSFISRRLGGRLHRLYRAVQGASPRAHVLAVGYPHLFNGEDCNAGTYFSPADERRLNGTADLLDRVISARSRARSFTFVDPRRVFTGHAVCDPREWLNGLSDPVTESYHPNRRGQSAYARLVARRLGLAAART